eukprot:2210789-Rhodomonas_salina.1
MEFLTQAARDDLGRHAPSFESPSGDAMPVLDMEYDHLMADITQPRKVSKLQKLARKWHDCTHASIKQL